MLIGVNYHRTSEYDLPLIPFFTAEHVFSSMTGIYSVAESTQRPVPTSTNDVTRETIHPSVLKQKSLSLEVSQAIQGNPSIVPPLSDMEQLVKDHWHVRQNKTSVTIKSTGGQHGIIGDVKSFTEKIGHDLLRKIDDHRSSAQQGPPGTTSMVSVLEEHSMGSVLKHILHTQK